MNSKSFPGARNQNVLKLGLPLSDNYNNKAINTVTKAD